jgi:hypothetical protein
MRSGRRLRQLSSLVLLAFVGCSSYPRWQAPRRVEAAGFRLHTDVEASVVAQVIAESERFRAKLERWSGFRDRGSLALYLFSSYDEFQRVTKARGEGITFYGSGGALVALPLWPLEREFNGSERFVASVVEAVGADWRHRLRHELTHVHYRDSDSIEGDWLWEGLADYLAHDGREGGLKAQRLLSLKEARRQGRLRSFSELRGMSVNAGCVDAELRYAEAWSYVYTLLDLCGPSIRGAVRSWLSEGATSALEELLAEHRLTLPELERRRLCFIDATSCWLTLARPLDDPSVGLAVGDRLLRLDSQIAGVIHRKGKLGLILSWIYGHGQPPTAEPDLSLLVARGPALFQVRVARSALSASSWRLEARPRAALTLNEPSRRQR